MAELMIKVFVYEYGVGKDLGQTTLWKGSAFYYAKNCGSKENK